MRTIKFSPSTGAVRLFQSYNLAQEWFPNAFLIVRPQMFNEVTDHKGRLIPLPVQYQQMYWWARHRGYDLEPVDQIDEDYLWQLAWNVGDAVSRAPQSLLIDPTPQKVLSVGFVVDLDKAATVEGVPKQAIAIARGLAKARHDFYTEAEMRVFLLGLVADRVLKTKQDSWRIFRYYRKALADQGVLVYNDQAN